MGIQKQVIAGVCVLVHQQSMFIIMARTIKNTVFVDCSVRKFIGVLQLEKKRTRCQFNIVIIFLLTVLYTDIKKFPKDSAITSFLHLQASGLYKTFSFYTFY